MLEVQFRSGGVYGHYGVDPHLFERILAPPPWRRIERFVKARQRA
ncbi:hypothetical protein [Demequina aurantiaca]